MTKKTTTLSKLLDKASAHGWVVSLRPNADGEGVRAVIGGDLYESSDGINFRPVPRRF